MRSPCPNTCPCVYVCIAPTPSTPSTCSSLRSDPSKPLYPFYIMPFMEPRKYSTSWRKRNPAKRDHLDICLSSSQKKKRNSLAWVTADVFSAVFSTAPHILGDQQGRTTTFRSNIESSRRTLFRAISGRDPANAAKPVICSHVRRVLCRRQRGRRRNVVSACVGREGGVSV